MKKELMKDTLPCFLRKLEHLVSEYKGPYVCGEAISWADFWVANFTNIWEELFDKNILELYDSLRIQKDKVFCIPQIKEWNVKRPKTFV